MKITKSQLKQIIKEEASRVLGEGSGFDPQSRASLVAASILDPHPAALDDIAAAAGARMIGIGNQVTSPYREILQQIKKYIEDICAPAIVKIVEEIQNPQDPRAADIATGGGFPLTNPELP